MFLMRTQGVKLAIFVASVIAQFNLFGRPVAVPQISGVKVSGVVRDNAGGSLPKARLTFKSETLKTRIVSNEDGTFELELPVGNYEVFAKSEGCREFKLKE